MSEPPSLSLSVRPCRWWWPALFLYVIPRGLRLLLPLLQALPRPVRVVRRGTIDPTLPQFFVAALELSLVPPLPLTNQQQVTYMAGFKGLVPVRVERCTPAHQPGAAWPLYLYHLHPHAPPPSTQL